MFPADSRFEIVDGTRTIAQGRKEVLGGRPVVVLYDQKDKVIGVMHQPVGPTGFPMYFPTTGSRTTLSEADVRRIQCLVVNQRLLEPTQRPVGSEELLTPPNDYQSQSSFTSVEGPQLPATTTRTQFPNASSAPVFRPLPPSIPAAPAPAPAKKAPVAPVVAPAPAPAAPAGGRIGNRAMALGFGVLGVAALVDGWISPSNGLALLAGGMAVEAWNRLQARPVVPVAVPVAVAPALIDFSQILAQPVSKGTIQLKLIDPPNLLNIQRVDTLEQAVMGNVLQALSTMPGLITRLKQRLQGITEDALFSKGAAVVGDTTQTQNPKCSQKKLRALLELAKKFAVITDKTACNLLGDQQVQLIEFRDLLRTITENGLDDLRGLTDANKQAILQARALSELYVTLTNSGSVSKEHLAELNVALRSQTSKELKLPEDILQALIDCVDGSSGHVRQIDINQLQIDTSGQFPETVYVLAPAKGIEGTLECSIGARTQKYTAGAIMFGGEKTLTTSVKVDGKWFRGQDPQKSKGQFTEDTGVSIEELGRNTNTKPHLVVYHRETSVSSKLRSMFA